MKIKMFRKVLRQAERELGRLTAFGTENGRVYRLRYPVGQGWVYDWMFGMRLDIYGNPRDKRFAVHKIARILWERELKEYWTRKVNARTEEGSE